MNFNPLSWKISVKIPVMIVAVGVIAVTLTGTFSYFSSKHAVEKEAGAKLTAVLEDRVAALSLWLRSIEGDLTVQSQNPLVLESLAAFKAGWNQLGADQGKTLQRLYITDNPHPTGQKEKLDAAQDGSAYSVAHAKYHPYLRSFLEDRGYYDIFLFDPKGNLVYSVFKELDYATNLVSGKWSKTDLGKAFTAARDNPKQGTSNFFDFKAYAPSNGAPASFISLPLIDGNNQLQGVLVFQMPIGKLNELMQQKAGLGESGETYLVGVDLLMRSDSRFSKESTILKTKIDTEQVNLAVKDQTGLITSQDYRGVPVVAAYKPIKFKGVTWAVLAEQDYAEAYATVISMRQNLLLGSAAGILLIAFFGFLAGRGIARPISQTTGVMARLAEGDNSVEIPGMNRTDEIGEMSKAVQVFKDNAIENERLVAEQEAQKLKTEEEKKAMMNELADTFNDSVGGIIDSVSSAASQLNSTAQSMSGIAEETSSQSAAVSAASEEAATNVQTVAAATEEMSVSISEINQQISQASEAAQKAVSRVQQTGVQIETLAATADKISDVINIISDIADQTNLLALNATIESARAGEAGKGFAVVANEVKGLAGQTGKATEEIIRQVEEIQAATRQSVVSIEDIGRVINEVEEASSAIAAAMEEQSTVTMEITRNVQQAASGSDEVTRNIVGVNQASQETGAASGQVMSASEELLKQSDFLKAEVEKFVTHIRTA